MKYIILLISSICIVNVSLAYTNDSICKNNLKISSTINFALSIKTFGLMKVYPVNIKDSSISDFAGFSQTIFLGNNKVGIGGGIGIEALSIDRKLYVSAPVFLSTKLKFENFPVGLILKAGTYLLDKNSANLNKANFFDMNVFITPKNSIASFGLSYRKIISNYKNERFFSNEYLSLNINISID